MSLQAADAFMKIFGFHRVEDIRCKKCGGEMKDGIALKQTITGTPDFHGDNYATTVSPGGPGIIISCRKCLCCGWSVT